MGPQVATIIGVVGLALALGFWLFTGACPFCDSYN